MKTKQTMRGKEMKGDDKMEKKVKYEENEVKTFKVTELH